ncbi:MAG: phosphatidylserine decarboxylase [Flavobacteriales bacterium]|jgi:phosphatidylserine decarboxylase|nr:phosphatidylserine decarboxylase [Flavobacteriales bacterium]
MKIKYIDRASGDTKTEHPPAEGLLKFLYDNPFGKTLALPLIKRKLLSEIYGRRMDAKTSIKKIKPFVEDLNIDMTESLLKIDQFSSFNDFFYRKLKPESRPIGDGFVSPGDGRLLAFENIDSIHSFFVKGRKFTLSEFLQDHKLAKKYEGGTLIILRLAPNDYHRFHFPFDGTPSEVTKIKGSYFSVSPYALANNFTTVFCENKREFCTLTTKEKGDLLLVPIGATMVGSIIETYRPNASLKKGAEMGYFAFGGSTVVVLAEAGKLTIDQDILTNTANQIETFVKMGEKIGS